MPGRSRRAWRFRLNDILQAISHCRTFTAGMDRASFEADRKTVDAVVRNIEVIGEAAHNLPPWLTKKYPEAWNEMVGMRNVIAHGYWAVDIEIVWATLVDDLSQLERSVAHILESEADRPD